jgi:hypothetical protein
MFDVEYSQEGESSICVFMASVYILVAKINEAEVLYCKFRVLGRKNTFNFEEKKWGKFFASF